MTIKTGKLFESIPATLSEELFTDLVRGENVTIQRIVSRGQSSPESGWYDQNDNEWVVVLQGEAQLAFENGEVVQLAKGDHVNIPAHVKHRVSWTSPDQQTLWLAVHYK